MNIYVSEFKKIFTKKLWSFFIFSLPLSYDIYLIVKYYINSIVKLLSSLSPQKLLQLHPAKCNLIDSINTVKVVIICKQ